MAAREMRLLVKAEPFVGKSLVIPCVVNWFPRRTEDQLLANAICRENDKPEPFPDPNLIDVILTFDREPR